ncbi:unnamed protein product [Didymodactylos carnosus]|uniref:Uncharacterized protein n=2 Tax=Didymodactylos carnosus TaxID=1234261 RepID=A0A814GK00_9BILA|nr:unnamed protein product [Didymodactylos carnosus]CAF3768834.1 unnamed protein product [Didymodactylos carnosus]
MDDSLGLPASSQLIYGTMEETLNSAETLRTLDKINKKHVAVQPLSLKRRYNIQEKRKLTCSPKYKGNQSVIQNEIGECYPKSSRSKQSTNEHRNYEPLKKWYEKHHTNPYPTPDEKKILAKKANMTITQVGNWFSFERYKEKTTKIQTTTSTTELQDDDHEEIIGSLPIINSAPVQCGWNAYNEEIDVSGEDSEFDMLPKAGSSHSKQEPDLPFRTFPARFADQLPSHLTRTRMVNHDKMIVKVEQQQMVISISNLNTEQMSKVEQFIKKFKILNSMSDIIDETTTHLVTDELDDQLLVCTLTKNVIRAITRHLYVVSYRWIIDCLKQESIINYEDYEIHGDTLISSQHNGPRTSRLNKRNLLFPVNIFVKISSPGYMGINVDGLSELVWSNGATYVQDNPFPRTASERLCIELTEDELINDQQAYKNGIEQGIHYLHPKWLIDSIVKHKVQPIWKYQCAPVFEQ